MEARLRATPEQFAVLIKFMERHGDLSRLQPGPQARIRGDRLWIKLGSLLNSVDGGVQKSLDKWKRVWADWKTKTKKKYLSMKQPARGASRGPNSKQSLNALEKRVIAILRSAVVGQASIQDQEFSKTPVSVKGEGSVLEYIIEVPPSQNAVAASSPTPISTPTLVRETAVSLSSSPPSSPPTSPLPPTSPPPPPQTPPIQRTIKREASTSPRPPPTARRALKTRRSRGMTPFDRAVSDFVGVEQRRLEHEEARDQRLHEREMERLRLESRRIEVDREHNQLLQQLSLLGQELIDVLTQHRQFARIPSADGPPHTY